MEINLDTDDIHNYINERKKTPIVQIFLFNTFHTFTQISVVFYNSYRYLLYTT